MADQKDWKAIRVFAAGVASERHPTRHYSDSELRLLGQHLVDAIDHAQLVPEVPALNKHLQEVDAQEGDKEDLASDDLDIATYGNVFDEDDEE